MGLKKFIKKVAKVAIPAAAAYYGGPAAASLFTSASQASPVRSSSAEGYDLGTLERPNPPPNYGSASSPGMWGFAGQLASGAASLAGGMMANSASSKQAQQQMDFQRQMSNTSYQRGTKDMMDAGLNPMLAYSQGGASSPGGASAPQSDVISPAVNSARQSSFLNAQLENMQAQNAAINAQTQNTNADTASKLLGPAAVSANTALTNQNTTNAQTRNQLDKLDLQLGSESFAADVKRRRSEGDIAGYNVEGAKTQAEFQKQFGILIPMLQPILNTISSAVGGAGKIGDIVDIARRRSQRGKIIDLNR
ncbi:MAG: DNA pilot protein [Microvirus sp.]|nr:MAG: DNA pilot protein [Microvirus sp.]